MSTRLSFDPTVIGTINGKKVYRIAGGSAMFPDDQGGGMDIEVDDPTAEPRRGTRDDDDDDDDDDRRVSGDDDDDDAREDDEEQRVPKAELDRAKSALKNERRERKRIQREYEEKVKALQSESTEASVIEVEKARIDERNKRDAYWTEEIIRAKAEAEFAAQGATSDMAGRLAELVKLKNVEWDETNREWDGLEDEVDAIVQANPEFFKAKDTEEAPRSGRRQPTGRPRVDGASRGGQGGGAPRKRPSSAQLLAQQALGNPRGRRR